MARVIIACETLKQELNTVMKKLGCADPVIWLEAGDHNVPHKRREAIEKALRSCSQYDTAALVMSFCGGALAGLDSGEKTLLLPCFDDCVGLLLPCRRRNDAYYLTDGWLAGDRNLLAEYRNSMEKYGQTRTERIFSAMLRGYRSLIWLDCPGSAGMEQARQTAELLGLDFETVPSSFANLEDLLAEKEAPHILRIPPNTKITPEMRGGMIPVTLQGREKTLYSVPGENLLALLRRYGLAPSAPCGGQGTCGKCAVAINGMLQKSCCVTVSEPMDVSVPQNQPLRVLHDAAQASLGALRAVAAVDIGTTSIVCSLLDKETGKRIAVKTAVNPQTVWGADVVTRLRSALDGHMNEMTGLIRRAVSELLTECCRDAGMEPESVERISVVGNPAMEQLFLGISPENLVRIPFAPVLTEAKPLPCRVYLPRFPQAELLAAPNISGYVGGDTLGCILAENLTDPPKLTLLVDIGTNGEMVLAGGNRLVACAAAAGPALEGANIRFGMTAAPGAIDHVWLEEREIRYSVIGNAVPVGICGSGLIDAVAVFLQLGKINGRGRIESAAEAEGQRILSVCEGVYLTQEDIHQVQLAKGAIAAGIRMMADRLGIALEDIDRCLLAGAFGTYSDPDNACRIGLLPPELAGKVRSVGNAAARGAEKMALDPGLFAEAQAICRRADALELASLPDFPKTFAKSMRFA